MPASTEPLTDHKQLGERVSERLRNMISGGTLRPGEWLRQERLASELGVSYTPIREALKQLASEGLVEHVPYRGVRVVEFSPDDVLDMYAMRVSLEGLAAAAAAENITPAQLGGLRELHELMIAAEAENKHQNLPQIRELNRQFHRAIIEASARPYLIRILHIIWTWFPAMLWGQFVQTANETIPDWEEVANPEHAAIIAALEAHDSAAAERLMRAHIDEARRLIVKFLQSNR